jgi:UDP-N-acetylmuramate dehydrogenase
MEVLEHIPLAQYTTFNIGGAARYLVHAQSLDDIKQSFAMAQQLGVPVFVLGGGSNVLVADEGFAGMVIKIEMKTTSINRSSATVTVEAGAVLKDTIMQAAQAGLGGCTSMYGIPGTVGGAVRGNAGAFGTEAKDVVHSVTAWNSTTHETKEFANAECQFAYRDSFFKQHPEWIVLSATLQLPVVKSEEAVQQCEDTFAERTKRQIQNIKSAGSFFMNPVAPADVQELFKTEKGQDARGGRVPAGWLIDKSGYKGYTAEHIATGARSSNYIINIGGATAHEVRALGTSIQTAVKQTFGVDLHTEVQFVS